MKGKMDITIVTAFFNIGRGKIKNEVSKNLKRGTEIYFDYFSFLAELDNDMIIFTEEKYKEKIQKMRGNKKTKIITFDLNKKFSRIIKKIREIQESDEFKRRVNPDEIHNLEYWLPEYVLINNMKSYLIKTAIIKKMIETELVAWVDFGYIRNRDILNNVKKWQYNFNKEKIHFFNIFKKAKLKKKLKKKEDVYKFIFNNDTIIIGGVIVGAVNKWNEFYKKLRRAQNNLLKENIVDDDQGVYIKIYFENKKMFKLNYLGKGKWFSLFKKYDRTSKIQKIRRLVGLK
jgi:protein htrL